MTTYTATLYQPGQAAQILTAKQLNSLDLKLTMLSEPRGWQGADGLYMIADEVAVCALLKIAATELLAGDDTCAIYGLSNAVDCEATPNPAAEQAMWARYGECELAGPILVVEEANAVPAAINRV